MRQSMLTRSAWRGGVVALLVMLNASIANAQANDEDIGKRYIRCAAVLATASAVGKDQKAKERFSSGSMLLLLWASELGADRPEKERLDQVTRDFGLQVVEVGREVKLKTPSAASEFATKYGGELNQCGALLADEMKNRKKP